MVYPERMKANLESLGGLVHSQRVLLALVEAGLAREEAYRIVQDAAMRIWKTREDFRGLLKKNKKVLRHLSPAAIDKIFDLKYHTKHVGAIFNRVFQ
jgi:adenylosuccinate lyase